MPSNRRSISDYRFAWIIPMFLVITACAVAPFDVLLAKFFMSDPLPGELRSLIHKSEFFGHAYGILGIAFTIYLLCERRRREIPRLLVTAFSAGILCDVVKILVHRIRPVDFSFADGEATLIGISFFHVDSIGQLFESSYHSFPSAHSATAVAFAMALGAMFPKAARWFLILAATVALSRFDGGAHYVSDTLVGAILGYTAGCWLLGPTWASAYFAEYEKGNRSLWPYSLRGLGSLIESPRVLVRRR